MLCTQGFESPCCRFLPAAALRHAFERCALIARIQHNTEITTQRALTSMELSPDATTLTDEIIIINFQTTENETSSVYNTMLSNDCATCKNATACAALAHIIMLGYDCTTRKISTACAALALSQNLNGYTFFPSQKTT